MEPSHLPCSSLTHPAAILTPSIGVLRWIRVKEFLHGKSESPEPTFLTYTEDMVDGVRWRWRWRGNQIDGLWCFCPVCDAQLVHSEEFSEISFICERCPSDGTFFPHGSRGRVVGTVMGGDMNYAVTAVKREILRRIRTGEWEVKRTGLS